MFLNYKRIPLAYVLLSIFTLGYYSIVYRRDAARDLNIAFGEKKIDLPDSKHIILHYLTLGIYSAIWDIKFLKLCDEYILSHGKETEIDYESYRFLAAMPIVRFLAVKHFVEQINTVCRIYSDKQLEDVDTSDLTDLNRVRDVDVNDIYKSSVKIDSTVYDFSAEKLEMEKPKKEEKKEKEEEEEDNSIKQYESRMIAGHAVVEEYDPSVDYRRIGYMLRFEREDRVAEREEEEKRKREEEEKAKIIEENKPKTIKVISSRRTKLWFVKVAALTLLVFMIPFALITAAVCALPPVYDESYVGALSYKYDILNNDDKRKKIVIIGGDSVAMGIDSQIIEEELYSYRIVNFGADSRLGIKMLLDISRSSLKNGDIVIISPEITEKSMSLQFDGKAALEALDGNLGLMMQIKPENYSSLIGASMQFASSKLGYIIDGEKPQPTRPAYSSDNIDKEYGDNTYSRPFNETFGAYDKVTFDFKAKLKDREVTPYEEFIQYVNQYTHYAEKKGATVYFSFSPICEKAIDSSVTEKSIEAFYSNLCSVLQCRVISDVKDCIMEAGYFFDNAFNLNDAGKTARTLKLVDDIKRELLDDSANSETAPQATGHIVPPVVVETEADRKNAEDFEFEMFSLHNGANNYVYYYCITGISTAGSQKETLTVPNMYNGIPVVSIAANAFKGSAYLQNVELSRNIAVIDADAFSESTVKKVYFAQGIAPHNIYIGEGFAPIDINGNAKLTFYISASELELFKNDDKLWSKYSIYMAEKP